jgi:hypothetical protein
MTTVPQVCAHRSTRKEEPPRTALDTNRSVYRAIESGQLAALKLGTGTGTFRVSGAAVAAYAEACVQAAYQSWFPEGGSADHGGNQPTGRSESAVGVAR